MKKIIMVICVLLVAGAAFADTILQMDFQGVGLSSWKAGDNISITDKSGTEFSTYSGTSVSVMRENNSDNSEPFHFRSGCSVGLDGYGLTIMPSTGFAVKVAENDSYIVELSTDIKLGICLTDANDIFPAGQLDLMLNLMKADRKGLFGSVGLTDHFDDLGFPSIKAADTHIGNYCGLIIAAGWRF